MITFWDNNIGANRAYFRALCEALIPLKRYWSAQTSLDTLTEESARLMARAGCRYVYVGLESLSADSLRIANKRHNRVQDYRRRLDYLHRHGISVMSIFLLGLDGDTREYLRRVPDLVDEIGVDIPVFSLPVPIEGTPYRAQLAAQGRLLPGDLLDASDAAQLVFRPHHVTPDELELALAYCMRRSYSGWRIARRVARRLRNGVLPAVNTFLVNRWYGRYQRAVALTGLRRIHERDSWAGAAVPTQPADGRSR
jgi:radical SAM superfamily enzyme YgiQ (UPF0313 family)